MLQIRPGALAELTPRRGGRPVQVMIESERAPWYKATSRGITRWYNMKDYQLTLDGKPATLKKQKITRAKYHRQPGFTALAETRASLRRIRREDRERAAGGPAQRDLFRSNPKMRTRFFNLGEKYPLKIIKTRKLGGRIFQFTYTTPGCGTPGFYKTVLARFAGGRWRTDDYYLEQALNKMEKVRF